MQAMEYKEASVKGNYMGMCIKCKATIINADKRCHSCKECDEIEHTNKLFDKSKDIVKLLMYTSEFRTLTIDERLALHEAIRCVELLPELMEALGLANNIMFGLDDGNCYVDVYGYNIEILKKAKGVRE